MWVGWEYLIELDADTKHWIKGRKFGGEDICDPLKMDKGEWGLQQVVCHRTGKKLLDKLGGKEGDGKVFN